MGGECQGLGRQRRADLPGDGRRASLETGRATAGAARRLRGSRQMQVLLCGGALPLPALLFQGYYFWLCWVFVAACGLSLVVARGSHSLVAAHGLYLVAGSWGYSSLQCARFSLRWLLLLLSTDSRVQAL